MYDWEVPYSETGSDIIEPEIPDTIYLSLTKTTPVQELSSTQHSGFPHQD